MESGWGKYKKKFIQDQEIEKNILKCKEKVNEYSGGVSSLFLYSFENPSFTYVNKSTEIRSIL